MKEPNSTTFHQIVMCLAALLLLSDAEKASADTFGSGSNTFDIEFVTIGNAGNAADTTGSPNPAGKVDYQYRIGKFEISEGIINKANTLGNLGITHGNRGDTMPVTSISWYEAATFVNWLNGDTPAYKFDTNGNFQLWQPGDPGYDPNNLFRNSLASYFLPSVDEWYKAAYHDASAGTAGTYFDFPTSTGVFPFPVSSGTDPNTAVYNAQSGPAEVTQAGGLSSYGTMGQGGNVWEWQETESDLVNDSTTSGRIRRGGYWLAISSSLRSTSRSSNGPSNALISFGFRVASIVEPVGDFDESGFIDGDDFLNWQRGESPTPFSGSDLSGWQTLYGSSTSQPFDSHPVPEPTGLAVVMAMLFFGGLSRHFYGNSVRRDT